VHLLDGLALLRLQRIKALARGGFAFCSSTFCSSAASHIFFNCSGVKLLVSLSWYWDHCWRASLSALAKSLATALARSEPAAMGVTAFCNSSIQLWAMSLTDS
jgi:hypothetical protein